VRKPPLDKYLVGDSRNLVTILPNYPFIDVTITSPPYWNLKDYGSTNQIGYGQDYLQYLDDLERIFKALHGITKTSGSLWIVADTIKCNGELLLFPFDLANRIRQAGWLLNDIIVWHKDKTLPWSHRGKLRNIFEYVLFFSKTKRFKYHLSAVRETFGLKEWWRRYPERYSPNGKAPTRTWYVPIPRQGSWGENLNWVRHFCPLPPELVRRILLLASNRADVVLDPFAGSGVVLAQAKALGRRYVGIDLRKKYRAMFTRDVLPSILRSGVGDSKKRIEQQRHRKRFSSLIWQRRKIKYPRELVRLYMKEFGRHGIQVLVALSTSRLTLRLVVGSPKPARSRAQLRNRLTALMSRPPLSKYGLNVTLCIFNTERGWASRAKKENLRPSTKLFSYAKGKIFGPAKLMPLRILRETIEKNGVGNGTFPIIASNVKMETNPMGTLNSQLSLLYRTAC
jgi:DNA modification methylase